ncbi:type II secretion system F family protein [Amycolatopsis sp. NPDC059657]|uniref:type II secretion system F family protein n=1 Tax=Amycolatopsis sp. NPDC059657 TaxID=3346899 RepID=UPI00366CEA49
MTTTIWAILIGTLGGLAVFCVLWACLRPAPINLTAALGRIDNPDQRPQPWADRLADWALASGSDPNSRWWGYPLAELDLVGISPGRYLLRRLTWAGIGGGLVALCWLTLVMTGAAVPAELAAFGVLGGSMAGIVVPALALREEVAAVREEFRRGLAVYLDLVAQERATGRAPAQALREASGISDSRVFRRIRATLGHAVHSGITPWVALTELGDRVGVPELADLAAIMSSASDGAAVYTSLTAQAKSLRQAALSADRAEANARSERLDLPVTVLLIGFLILLLYPTVSRLLIGQ